MVKTTLKIDGMMCGMCESHVNDAIRGAFQVKKVTSSHSKGETVIISEEALPEAKSRKSYSPPAMSSKAYQASLTRRKDFSEESKPNLMLTYRR